MRKAWREVAVYFGFAERDERDEAEVVYARHDLRSGVAWALMLAVTSTAIARWLLGWNTADLPLGMAIGTVAFAVLHYGSHVRHQVPDSPLGRPPDWTLLPERPREIWRSVAWLGALVPLLWALDFMHHDEYWYVIPGQFLGIALADLLGLALVARWEEAHHSQVVVRRAGGDVTGLYAVPRL